MYVCMYRGRPSWNCPWEGAIQLGQGEGPIGIVGPISQPRGTNGTASLTLDHTYALLCVFWANFTLGSWGYPGSSYRRYSDTPGPNYWGVSWFEYTYNKRIKQGGMELKFFNATTLQGCWQWCQSDHESWQPQEISIFHSQLQLLIYLPYFFSSFLLR